MGYLQMPIYIVYSSGMQFLWTIMLFCGAIHLSFAQQQRSPSAQDTLGYAYYYHAAVRYADPMPDSALIYAQRAAELARRGGLQKELSLAVSVETSALVDIGKSVEALEQGRTALLLAQKVNDTLAMAWAHFAVGYASGQRITPAKNDVADNNAALKLLRQALFFSTRVADNDLIMNSCNALGRIYRKLRMFDSALVYHKQAVEFAKISGNRVQAGWALYSIAVCYEAQKDLKTALSYALQSVDLRRQVGNAFPIAISLGTVARLHSQMGNKRQALSYAEESLLYAQKSGQATTLVGALERYALFANDMGKYKEAFAYYRKFVDLRDSLTTVEQQNDVRTLSNEVELERSKHEKALLLQQQHAQEARLERQRIIVLATGAIAGLLVVAIALVVRSQRRIQRQNATLSELNREMREQQTTLEEYATNIEHKNQLLDAKNTELLERNNALVTLDSEKTEILGVVAHDLRNPISAIGGLVEILQTPSVSKEAQKNILEQLSLTSVRMLDLVNNLLDSYRIEHNLTNMQLAPLDVEPLAEMILQMYTERAAVKNISLHFQTLRTHDTASTVAKLDEQSIQQVLDNLISNAVKYSPFNTNIVVRVKTDGVAVRVEVQDEGQGILPNEMSKLFGKFTRLSAQPTGGEHSSGLGLSIVKKLVETMNGRVWCESEQGKGATFIVEFAVSNHT